MFGYVTHPSFPLSDFLPRSRPSIGHSRASSTGSFSSGAYDFPPVSDREEQDLEDDEEKPTRLPVRRSIPRNSQIIRYDDEDEDEEVGEETKAPDIPLVRFLKPSYRFDSSSSPRKKKPPRQRWQRQNP